MYISKNFLISYLNEFKPSSMFYVITVTHKGKDSPATGRVFTSNITDLLYSVDQTSKSNIIQPHLQTKERIWQFYKFKKKKKEHIKKKTSMHVEVLGNDSQINST